MKEHEKKVVDVLENAIKKSIRFKTAADITEEFSQKLPTGMLVTGVFFGNDVIQGSDDLQGNIEIKIAGREHTIDVTFWYYVTRGKNLVILEYYIEDETIGITDHQKWMDRGSEDRLRPVSKEAFDILIEEAREREGDTDEPLDGDAVDTFIAELKSAMNYHEGNH